MHSKVFVLGLDGVSFNVLDRVIQEGVAPNLRQAIAEAATGDLQSILPAVTYPAWKAYATGLDPSQLGVYWWRALSIPEKRIRQNTARSFRGREVWDHLSAKDIPSIVVNMPSTYPPHPIQGVMVAGAIADDDSAYAYPERVQQDLERRFRYYITPRTTDPKEAIVLIQKRFEAAFYLMETRPWYFFHLTIFLIDHLLHLYFSKEGLHPVLAEAWQVIDQNFGHLRYRLSATQNALLMVMSDHGMVWKKGQLNLNAWLRQQGYLAVRNVSSIVRQLKPGISV